MSFGFIFVPIDASLNNCLWRNKNVLTTLKVFNTIRTVSPECTFKAQNNSSLQGGGVREGLRTGNKK